MQNATLFSSGIKWANTMTRITLERRIRYLVGFYLVTPVDCAFGVFGIIPLYLAHRYVRQLEAIR